MIRPANLVTDVPGVTVGQAHDPALASGVTVMLFDRPATASVFVPGGAPGGRGHEPLALDGTVQRVDALVLSGGSSFGLDAATGVDAWLRARGRGVPVRDVRVPIVASAILFDLLNGGDKEWGRFPPYRDLAWAACEAAGRKFALGSAGAGHGATTVDVKGGLGSTSATASTGATVGALVAVNAIGSALVGSGPHFWAAPFERQAEFGGLGLPGSPEPSRTAPRWKGGSQPATTIAIVATDATLDKPEARRLAIMASAGLARALRVTFAPADGDTVFAASTRLRPRGQDDLTELGSLAADCLARAVARAIYEAQALPFPGALPAWRDLFVGRAT